MSWKKGGIAFSSSQEHSPAAQRKERQQQQEKGKSKFFLTPRVPRFCMAHDPQWPGLSESLTGILWCLGSSLLVPESLFSSFSPTGLNSGALQESSSGSG